MNASLGELLSSWRVGGTESLRHWPNAFGCLDRLAPFDVALFERLGVSIRVFPRLSVLVLRVSSTRTRTYRIEYVYEKNQNCATSTPAHQAQIGTTVFSSSRITTGLVLGQSLAFGGTRWMGYRFPNDALKPNDSNTARLAAESQTQMAVPNPQSSSDG